MIYLLHTYHSDHRNNILKPYVESTGEGLWIYNYVTGFNTALFLKLITGLIVHEWEVE